MEIGNRVIIVADTHPGKGMIGELVNKGSVEGKDEVMYGVQFKGWGPLVWFSSVENVLEEYS